jgi:hypothetical protein
MLLGELVLATADVYDQPECQGNILAVGKEGDLLRNSVLEDFDVVFGQVVQKSTARIMGRESDNSTMQWKVSRRKCPNCATTPIMSSGSHRSA